MQRLLIQSDGTLKGTTVADNNAVANVDVVRVISTHSCHADPSRDDLYVKLTVLLKLHDNKDAAKLPYRDEHHPDYDRLIPSPPTPEAEGE